MAEVAHTTTVAPRGGRIGAGQSGAVAIRAATFAIAYGTGHWEAPIFLMRAVVNSQKSVEPLHLPRLMADPSRKEAVALTCHTSVALAPYYSIVIALSERVSAFIKSEGHVTEDTILDDSTITGFRSRGLNFSARTLANDDGFLELSCTMSLESRIEFTAGLLRALWDCQGRFKCVKFGIDEDATAFTCAIESYFAEPDGYQPTFWRSISTIEAALHAGLREIRTRPTAKAAAQKFIEEFTRGDAR